MLRREKGRPKGPERERKGLCVEVDGGGGIVSVIKMVEESSGLGYIAGRSCFSPLVGLYHILRKE